MNVVQRGGRSSGHVQNGRAVGDDDDGSGEDHGRGDGQRDTDRHPRSLKRQGERQATTATEFPDNKLHQLRQKDQSGWWTNVRKKIMLVTLDVVEFEMLAAV